MRGARAKRRDFWYNTDLTDKQWVIIRDMLRKENRGKHLRKHHKRELINAVLYLNKTGCQWELLPKEFPPYKTVSSFYHRAIKSGLWQNIMDALIKKTNKSEP
jgi:putative transposase